MPPVYSTIESHQAYKTNVNTKDMDNKELLYN